MEAWQPVTMIISCLPGSCGLQAACTRLASQGAITSLSRSPWLCASLGSVSLRAKLLVL